MVHEVPSVYQLRIFIARRHFDDFEFSPGPNRRQQFVFALSMEHFSSGIGFFGPTPESKQKAKSFVLPLRAENHDRSFRQAAKSSGDLFITYYEDTGNLVLNATSSAMLSEFNLVTYDCGPLSKNFFYPTALMASIVIKVPPLLGDADVSPTV